MCLCLCDQDLSPAILTLKHTLTLSLFSGHCSCVRALRLVAPPGTWKNPKTHKKMQSKQRETLSLEKTQSETERQRDVDSASASPHSWSPLWVYCGSLLLRCKQEDLNDLYCQQNKVQSLQSQEKQFEYNYKRIQYARVINTMSAQYLWDWIGGNDL